MRKLFKNLEESIRHLESEIEKYQIDKELAIQNETSLKEEIHKKGAEYEELQQIYSALMHQTNDYDQEKQILQDKISSLESKNEWLAASEIEHKKLIIGFEKEIKDLKQQIKELQEKTELLSKDKKQQSSKIQIYEQTIENDKGKIDSLSKE